MDLTARGGDGKIDQIYFQRFQGDAILDLMLKVAYEEETRFFAKDTKYVKGTVASSLPRVITM